PTNVLTEAKISGLVPAADGALWAATSHGLFRLDSEKSNPVAVITNRSVENLGMDSNGVLWASVDMRGNARIKGDAIQLTSIRYVWFQPGIDGNLWLAGAKGTLFRLSGETNVTAVARFENRRLSAICEDLEGNIWVGLDSHGLYRVHRKQVK